MERFGEVMRTFPGGSVSMREGAFGYEYFCLWYKRIRLWYDRIQAHTSSLQPTLTVTGVQIGGEPIDRQQKKN